MDKEIILRKAEEFVKEKLANDSSGHDWWHIHRVRNIACAICETEKGDRFIVELAALLHDLIDDKLFECELQGLEMVKDWLHTHGVDERDCASILEIISTMSFKGGNGQKMETKEGQIVQDADRLDAIGAIGIGRTFAYAGAKGQLMYDPNLRVRVEMSKEEYRKGKSTAINHFHEKLLKLSGLMNTRTAKRLAQERHQVMEVFLEQFLAEWNGEK